MLHDRSSGALDVRRAAARLRGHVLRTPTLRSTRLDTLAGGPVFIKAECSQLTGSFKVRGAVNWLLAHQSSDHRRGVVAFSAGNHAAGLAYAAGRFGWAATILMPSQAPAMKIAQARALGATLVLYDRERDDREALLAQHVERSGAFAVHAFEDPDVISGNGVAGLELLEAADRAGAPLQRLVVPCGGGGIGAGCVFAAEDRASPVQIVLVEPDGHDDMRLSLAVGRRAPAPGFPMTTADALMTPAPGARTFQVHAQARSEALSVSETEIRQAVRFAHEEFGLIVEPGGAAGLAAVLSGRMASLPAATGVILTGGNVDPGLLSDILLSPQIERAASIG